MPDIFDQDSEQGSVVSEDPDCACQFCQAVLNEECEDSENCPNCGHVLND